MQTRPAVATISLLLFTTVTVVAGDAMAQRTRADSRESNRSLVERRSDRGHAGHRDERSDDHSALSAAVRRVERRTGGQVLSAERVPYDGRDINRVKVVDASGRVRVYVDDPRSRAVRNDAPTRPRRTRDDDN
ncbi:PepSY domain-containing protein [Lysobacter sp. F6437]|uniref:PepSY domain-containing protein n=1 Tax=Lysobacter sp. F6437 TaxID=3459296 RepID=UPI00403DA111